MRETTRMTRRTLGGLVLLLALGVSLPVSADDFKVIVNRNVSLSEISKDAVKQIMMKKTAKLPDGTGAAPVDLPPDSPVRDAFSKDVLGRSASAVSSFWQRQIFSGKEVPPPSVGTDSEVISYVASVPGGLGYVSADTKLPASVVEVRLVD